MYMGGQLGSDAPPDTFPLLVPVREPDTFLLVFIHPNIAHFNIIKQCELVTWSKFWE